MQKLLGNIALPLNSAAASTDAASSQAAIRFESTNGLVLIKGYPRFAGSSGEKTAAQLLHGYIERGRRVLDELRGPFAVVVIPKVGNRALIAIDRMGIERLTYAKSSAQLHFGSSALDVARQLSPRAQLNANAFYAFMFSHMVPSPQTAFAGVSKLGPGFALEVLDEKVEEFRYWQPDFSRDRSITVSELAEQVQPTIARSIENSGVNERSGAFLSGGLDSSTVTGMLSEVIGGQAKAFSVGFGVAEFNELEFARISSQKFNCEHFTYDVTPDDIVSAIPEIARAYDEPFGNSSAVPTLACARLAKRSGVDHLFAGDGGDELFGGNERYVRQRVFETYQRIPGFIRQCLLDPLARRLDPEGSFLPLQKFASYVQQASIPLPERFESWNLIYREGAEQVFSKELLSRIDPSQHFQHMQDVWDDCPSNDLLDRMLWYDWKFILADNDLRKVTTMCELAGVRVSYPMLDEDLLDLSIKVPSAEKIRNGELRTFFKNSVRNLLPPDIITKTKHGFGLPFGQWLKTHEPLRELVFGSLDSLAERGLFDPSFIKRVGDEHRDGHASYYGYAIWDLISIEQWLQQHSNEIDTASLSA